MITAGDIKNEIRRIVGVASTKFMDNEYKLLSDEYKCRIKGVTPFWGNPLEIIKKLKEYTAHDELKFEKFPFIGLYNDITIFEGKYGDYDGTMLEIVMCYCTDPTWDSEKREIVSFQPILRPIAKHFYEELHKSRMFVIQDPKRDARNNRTERYFWGRQGLYGQQGNIFNDYVDAIHIQNLDLKITNPNC